MTDNIDHGREQAIAQLESVRALVAAMGCDYDRLEELRDERENLVSELESARECVAFHHDGDADATGDYPEVRERDRCAGELLRWHDENGSELAELQAEAGEHENEEQARDALRDDALSVEVRSSEWREPSCDPTDYQPDEYRIVLCTGGPHVEIRGRLNHYGEPESARLMYQCWGQPLTEFVTTGDNNAALRTYAEQFYYGEGG